MCCNEGGRKKGSRVSEDGSIPGSNEADEAVVRLVLPGSWWGRFGVGEQWEGGEAARL